MSRGSHCQPVSCACSLVFCVSYLYTRCILCLHLKHFLAFILTLQCNIIPLAAKPCAMLPTEQIHHLACLSKHLELLHTGASNHSHVISSHLPAHMIFLPLHFIFVIFILHVWTCLYLQRQFQRNTCTLWNRAAPPWHSCPCLWKIALYCVDACRVTEGESIMWSGYHCH